MMETVGIGGVTVTIKQEVEDDYYSDQCGQYQDNEEMITAQSDPTPSNSDPMIRGSLAPSASRVYTKPGRASADLPYACHTCRFETSEPDVIQNHTSLHSHPRPVCDICMLELEDFTCLQTHRLLHFNSAQVCYACDLTFVAGAPSPEQCVAYQGLLHLSAVHGEKHVGSEAQTSMFCPVCQQRFSDNKAFVYHMSMHAVAEVNNYFCKFCGLQFIGKRALQAHFSGPRHLEMKKKLADVFVCSECRIIFPNRDSYAMHQLLRAQESSCVGSRNVTSVCCPVCEPTPVILKSVQEFEAHLQSVHIQTAGAVVGKKTGQAMSCNICGEKMKDLDALMLHMFEHKAPSSQPAQKEKDPGESVEDRPVTSQSVSPPAPVIRTRQTAVEEQGPLMIRLQDDVYCKFCTARFDCKDSLAMHVMTDHTEDMMSTSDTRASPRSSSSSSSNSCYGNSGSTAAAGYVRLNANEFCAPLTVMQARADMHRKDVQMCGQCGMVFTSLDSLAMHMMSHAHHELEDVEKEKQQRVNSNLRTIKETLQPQLKRSRPALASVTEDALTSHSKRMRPASASMAEDIAAGPCLRHMSSPLNALSPPKRPASLHSIPVFSGAVNTAHHSASAHRDPAVNNRDVYIRDASQSQNALLSRPGGSRSSTPLSETAHMNPDTTHGENSPSTSGEASSIVDFVLENQDSLKMCKHCKIVFAEKTLYYLHMGLHNLNNAWQCNLCGRVCRDAREFSAHVIHF